LPAGKAGTQKVDEDEWDAEDSKPFFRNYEVFYMEASAVEILKIVGTIISILGAIFAVSWFFFRINSQLVQHETHIKEINSWKKETNKWKFDIIRFIRSLASQNQPADIREKNERLDEMLYQVSSNPITEEEKEKFNSYRVMASQKKPFSTEEYNDFKLLTNKFKEELPEEYRREFDNLMGEIFAFILPFSIDKLESELKIKAEETEIRDVVLGDQISGHLPQNKTNYFSLNGIQANGELKIIMEASPEADFELLVKYEILPTAYEWDFKWAVTGSVKEFTIFPTKSGIYYFMIQTITGGDFKLLAKMVGYYFLKTTSFFRANQQEELQRRTNIQKPLYDLRAILDTDIEGGLDRVERVEYYLPAWPEGNRLQVKYDARDKFQLKELAYGSCYLKASVYLRDLAEPIEFTEIISLQESGPRLLP
jgi:hypothetical protein